MADEDWIAKYTEELGHAPESADQLKAFVTNKGGSLSFTKARALIAGSSAQQPAVAPVATPAPVLFGKMPTDKVSNASTGYVAGELANVTAASDEKASNPWGAALKKVEKPFFTKGDYLVYLAPKNADLGTWGLEVLRQLLSVEDAFAIRRYQAYKIHDSKPLGDGKSKVNIGRIDMPKYIDVAHALVTTGQMSIDSEQVGMYTKKIFMYTSESEAEKQAASLTEAAHLKIVEKALAEDNGPALFFLSKVHSPLPQLDKVLAAHQNNVQRARAMPEPTEYQNFAEPGTCSYPSFLHSGEGGVRQLDVPPTHWALSAEQFWYFLSWCKAQTVHQQVRELQGYVNMYNVNKLFVMPLTRGRGRSIALSMNATAPLEASIMLSHAWGESVNECREVLDIAMKKCNLPDTTPLWFCLLAQYQPGDGPTVAEQIALSPFGSVIASEKVRSSTPGMLVLHTSAVEVYSRLWCVYEIDHAVECHVNVKGIASEASYILPHATSLNIQCELAECSVDSDKAMITEIVESNGGFKRLNKAIADFRHQMEQETGHDYFSKGIRR